MPSGTLWSKDEERNVAGRFEFDYPEHCTVDDLEVRLAELAPEWPGWPAFPWRVTRNIHRHLTHAPFNFHYLMVQRCITGFAAHLPRTEQFVDRAGVLAMLIRVRCEIEKMPLHLLLESIAREGCFVRRRCLRVRLYFGIIIPNCGTTGLLWVGGP